MYPNVLYGTPIGAIWEAKVKAFGWANRNLTPLRERISYIFFKCEEIFSGQGRLAHQASLFAPIGTL